MANIRKRGDKWQVQVRRQGFPSRTQSFCRQEEAKAWGRAQELAMDHGPGLLEPFLNQIWTLLKGVDTRG